MAAKLTKRAATTRTPPAELHISIAGHEQGNGAQRGE